MNEPNPTLPDYLKLPYLIIKKKLIKEDEAGMFEKFKEMLKQLRVSLYSHEVIELIPKFAKFMQVFLKGGKHKLNQEQGNMAKREEMIEWEEVPPKMTDSGEFNITCTIGGMKIPHSLCDLGSSINFMPLCIFKELEICEIVLNNMTLTLVDSSSY